MSPLWCEACSCSQHKSLTYLIRASVILRSRDKIISRQRSSLSRKHRHTSPFKFFCGEGSKRGGKYNIWLKLGLRFRKRMVCWNNNNKSKHKTPQTSFLPVLDVRHVHAMFQQHLLKFQVSFLSDPPSKLKSDSVSFSRNVARPRDWSGSFGQAGAATKTGRSQSRFGSDMRLVRHLGALTDIKGLHTPVENVKAAVKKCHWLVLNGS